MTDNSFSKVDKYDGYVIGPNGELLGPYTNQTHSSENGYANASNAGVSWYADLKGYIGVQPTKLYGSGTFKLAPKSTTTSGSTTLYGHYVHPKAELGLVLMFHLMVASPFPVVATMMSVVLKKQYLGKKKEGNPLLFYSSFLFSF